MVANILVMLILLAVAILFFWLAVRAGRIRRAYLRWPLQILAGLVGLVVAVFLIAASIGYYRINVPPEPVQAADIQTSLSSDQKAVAEGKASLCVGCHSTTGRLPLDGGKEDFLGMPLGTLYAPNLTPGGDLKDWSDGQVIRAIREGIDDEGHPLLVMPTVSFHNLSDKDVQMVVAYLRTQPAVDHGVPERSLTPLVAAMMGVGMFPTAAQPAITAPIVAPPLGTAEYGKYITLAYGCQDCHGPDMTGVPAGGFGPSGPNLTEIMPQWSEANFLQLFNDGKDPSGRLVDKKNMPWNEYGQGLSQEELKSVYLYLHGLPPAPMKN
jgi:mono/diheme cytochrome c family protein